MHAFVSLHQTVWNKLITELQYTKVRKYTSKSGRGDAFRTTGVALWTDSPLNDSGVVCKYFQVNPKLLEHIFKGITLLEDIFK